MFATLTTPVYSNGSLDFDSARRGSPGLRSFRPGQRGSLTGAVRAVLMLLALLVPRSGTAQVASTHAAPPAPRRVASLPDLKGDQAVRQLKQMGRYDSLQQAVSAARYTIRWDDRPASNGVTPAYHAPNPGQDLDAYFGYDGLLLVSRTRAARAPERTWRTGMRFVGYGHGDLLPAGDARPRALGNRVEYDWAGSIDEWFVNQPAGLEHGFTIETRPHAASPGQWLQLALQVTGDLTVEPTDDRQAVVMKDADGQVALRYRGLHAFDAHGQELPSRIEVRDGLMILEVDDEIAVYPVTVDPTFTQQAKLFADDGLAGDDFGYSVAIDANTAVVGAPFDDVNGSPNQGSAYVFVFSDGYWFQQAKLTAMNGESEDWFGYSVDIYWDTIVVGSAEYYQTSTAGSGAAYVFERSGSTWTQQARLTPSDGAIHDFFGHSVSISGNTVVAGAPYKTISGHVYQGAVYAFVRSGTTWSQQAKLTASDGAEANFFGLSVAIGTNTIAVGAHYASVGANVAQGAAYAFVRSGVTWTQQSKLVAGDGASRDYFGRSVAINGTGTRIVVGAPQADVGTNANQGAAYLFVRTFAPFWTQQAKLTAVDGAADDLFGASVAVSGYEVVVGAPNDDVFGVGDQGSAYVFVCNGTCGAAVKLTASSGALGDGFGYSVAIVSGTTSTVVVGSPFDDSGASANRGSIYTLVR